jgi:hypothetical protein
MAGWHTTTEKSSRDHKSQATNSCTGVVNRSVTYLEAQLLSGTKREKASRSSEDKFRRAGTRRTGRRRSRFRRNDYGNEHTKILHIFQSASKYI